MRRARVLHIAVALGLLIGLFAGAIGTASAAPEDPGQGTVYFPWVPNNDTSKLDGTGPWFGTVTVQNTEILPVRATVYQADGTVLQNNVLLNPRASKTWTAAALGLPEPGAGAYVTAQWDPSVSIPTLIQNEICAPETFSPTRGAGDADNVTVNPLAGETVSVERVFEGGTTFVAGTDYSTALHGNTLSITWLSGGARPAVGATYSVEVAYCPPPRISGAEKHASPSIGGNATTSAATQIVDGYNAVPDGDLALANTGGVALDGQFRWIQPIVQTNTGWDTVLYITNVSGHANVGVTATYYAANGQGFAGPSTMIVNQTLTNGQTVTLNLTTDAGFPAGQVGSVWIDADAAVVAQVFRIKPSTGMALTNTAAPRTDAGNLFGANPDVKYAPLVFRDYNGWNTGINIANLSSVDNQVTITYYNYAGNSVAVDSRTIPSRAMEFVYRPSTSDVNTAESQITSAIVSGSQPLAAAVDEVKYLGGLGEGHAMSYLAQRAAPSGDAARVDGRVNYDNLLALALVQKGDATGTGDTSGINLFNPNQNVGVNAWVQFEDTTGVPVAPTLGAGDTEQPIVVPMGALSGATIYTMNYSEMPAGFVGSAVVGVVSTGESAHASLAGVSNNVNYSVARDGSAAFNMAISGWSGPIRLAP